MSRLEELKSEYKRVFRPGTFEQFLVCKLTASEEMLSFVRKTNIENRKATQERIDKAIDQLKTIHSRHI